MNLSGVNFMKIEYENGIPKGYMERRKRAGIIYACSVYLFCAFNLLVKYHVLILENITRQLLYSLLIIISVCCLSYNILAQRNFKGLVMYNHNEFKAFTALEKLMYTLPVVVSAIFIPLEIITYIILAGASYSAVCSMADTNRNYDSYI